MFKFLIQQTNFNHLRRNLFYNNNNNNNLLLLNLIKFINYKSFKLENNKGVDKFGIPFETPEYPLPNTPKRLPRNNESELNLRARLIYQCRKRGILETDLILSTFIKKYMDELSIEECKELDKLLDENDWDIYYWVTETRNPPEWVIKTKIFNKLVEHTKNHEKKSLRMPDLE